MSTSSDQELQQTMLDDGFEFVKESWFIRPVHRVTVGDIPSLVLAVCTEFVINRSSNEMSQFEEGLQEFHLSSLIKCHPEKAVYPQSNISYVSTACVTDGAHLLSTWK